MDIRQKDNFIASESLENWLKVSSALLIRRAASAQERSIRSLSTKDEIGTVRLRANHETRTKIRFPKRAENPIRRAALEKSSGFQMVQPWRDCRRQKDERSSAVFRGVLAYDARHGRGHVWRRHNATALGRWHRQYRNGKAPRAGVFRIC